MKKISVYVGKRRTGCIRICPQCGTKNGATRRECSKCKADIHQIKRQFVGKGYTYNVQWDDPRTGRRKFISAGPDKQYAQHLAAKKREELVTGEYTGIIPITWDRFVAEHLEQLEDTHAEGTVTEHERTLKQFKEICDPKDLTVIDYPMLEKFRAARIAGKKPNGKKPNGKKPNGEKKVSPATINKCLRTLQACFSKAIDRGYLVKNPFHGKRKSLFIREAEPVPNPMEPQEFEKLLAACLDDRWRAICTIGYYAGLRQQEILHLEWSDVDFKNQLLHVRNKVKKGFLTKSRKNRDIPMTCEVISVLQRLQITRFQSEFIITSEDLDGRKMKNNIARDFAVICVRAGLVDEDKKHKFTMHNLRDSFVTNLLAVGADPKTVQALAGHSSFMTTMRYYASVRAKNMSETVNKLSGLKSKVG